MFLRYVRKNLVLQEAVELPLDGFFVFWGLALFPQWNVLLRRVGELFKTWASRITARAAPGEASGICPEYGAASGGARMRGRASGTEERRTWPYMKKTPADHVGHMVRRSSVRRTKRNTSEKSEIFSEKFLFSITTVYSWGNKRRLAKKG